MYRVFMCLEQEPRTLDLEWSLQAMFLDSIKLKEK